MARRPYLAAAMMLVCTIGLAATTAAPAAAASPDVLRLTVVRNGDGDHWWSEGAFVDAGTFVDDPAAFAGRSSTYHVFRTFTGDGGTFTARGDVRILPTSDPTLLDVTGRWAVVGGTGAYDTLHGAGVIDEVIDMNVGQISGSWTGTVVS